MAKKSLISCRNLNFSFSGFNPGILALASYFLPSIVTVAVTGVSSPSFCLAIKYFRAKFQKKIFVNLFSSEVSKPLPSSLSQSYLTPQPEKVTLS